MSVIKAMIEARTSQNPTQKELADGMDMILKIEFAKTESANKGQLR